MSDTLRGLEAELSNAKSLEHHAVATQNEVELKIREYKSKWSALLPSNSAVPCLTVVLPDGSIVVVVVRGDMKSVYFTGPSYYDDDAKPRYKAPAEHLGCQPHPLLTQIRDRIVSFQNSESRPAAGSLLQELVDLIETAEQLKGRET